MRNYYPGRCASTGSYECASQREYLSSPLEAEDAPESHGKSELIWGPLVPQVCDSWNGIGGSLGEILARLCTLLPGSQWSRGRAAAGAVLGLVPSIPFHSPHWVPIRTKTFRLLSFGPSPSLPRERSKGPVSRDKAETRI